MKIKWIMLFIVFFNTAAISQQKMLTAVLELKGEGILDSDARLISSRLRTYLFDTQKFTVVEREKMNEILKEQGFQMSGCTSNECAVEAGKLLGVKYIIAGDVGKIGKLYTISLRLIDVETGRLVRVISEDCECGIEEFLKSTIKIASYKIAGQTKIKLEKKIKDYLYISSFGGIGTTPLFSEISLGGTFAYGDSKIGRVGINTAIIIDELLTINLYYAYPMHVYKKFSFVPELGIGYLEMDYYYDEDTEETGTATGLGSFIGGIAELELVSNLNIEVNYFYGFSFTDFDANYDTISAGLSYKF
jgi:TolB-like protein